METRANYFLVASFVVAIVALSVIGAIWLLNIQPLPEARAYYEIYFKGSVAGLKVNAPVSLSGIPVGSVRKVEIDHQDPSGVHVIVEVRKDTAIKADSIASLEINFMFGDASISITAGGNAAPPLAVLPGHAYPVIASQPSQLQSIAAWVADFMQRTIEVLDALSVMLNDENRQVISQRLQTAEEATAQGVVEAKRLGDALDRYDSMLRGGPEQVTELNGSVLRLTQGLDSATSALDDVDAVIKSVGEWVRNFDNSVPAIRDQQLAVARTTMHDLAGMISEARGIVRHLARTVDDVERDPSRALFGGARAGGYKPGSR